MTETKYMQFLKLSNSNVELQERINEVWHELPAKRNFVENNGSKVDEHENENLKKTLKDAMQLTKNVEALAAEATDKITDAPAFLDLLERASQAYALALYTFEKRNTQPSSAPKAKKDNAPPTAPASPVKKTDEPKADDKKVAGEKKPTPAPEPKPTKAKDKDDEPADDPMLKQILAAIEANKNACESGINAVRTDLSGINGQLGEVRANHDKLAARVETLESETGLDPEIAAMLNGIGRENLFLAIDYAENKAHAKIRRNTKIDQYRRPWFQHRVADEPENNE